MTSDPRLQIDEAGGLIIKYARTLAKTHGKINPDLFADEDTKKIVKAAMSVMTIKQRAYIDLYFLHRIKMCDIATMYNVNKSTVSRTIRRGIHRAAQMVNINNIYD